MLTRFQYILGWLVLLLMGVLLVLGWVDRQQIMTGVPRPVLIVVALLLIAALIASVAARKDN